jgi:hypothetical protein
MVRELDDWRHEWRRISFSNGLGCQTGQSAALCLPKGISRLSKPARDSTRTALKSATPPAEGGALQLKPDEIFR